MDNRWSPEIQHVAEIVKGKLYFAVTYNDEVEPIKNTLDIFHFNVDDEYQYFNYYNDFGPLNVSCLYKYCLKLHSYMQHSQLKRIVHYTCSDPDKRVNGAYLLGSYCVVFLSMEPKTVYKKLMDAGGTFKQFVDASQGTSRYTLKLIECLQGIHKAYILNFIKFDDFSSSEYDLYDKIQNGDFNWLVPRKFLAMIGPLDKEVTPNGHAPSFYIKYFLKNDVTTVIRLNNKLYDSYVFTNAGIAHYDLFFPDGTTPPKHILLKFLQIAENTSGAIAVHCKAGLGRTGSLIGAYIMKHYQFTAKEAIAWMRMCRPGSVIGQQQGWLEKIEPWLWKEGRQYRSQQYGDGDKLPHHKFGIYSKTWQQNRKKHLMKVHKRAMSEGPNRNSMQVADEVMRVKTPDGNMSNLASNSGISNKENLGPRRCGQQSYLDARTQGDKLNEIKMRAYYNSYVSNHSNACYGRDVGSQNMLANDQALLYMPTQPLRPPAYRGIPNVASYGTNAKIKQSVGSGMYGHASRANRVNMYAEAGN